MPFISKKLVCALTIVCFVPSIRTEKGCPPQEDILPCRCLIRGKDYQIWCSHSNLSSVLDSIKSISKYIIAPIDELILENNYLPSLPGRTFAPLKILRLMLRHNTLERLSTDWLAGLESSLMELFIVEPKLNSLPQMSLIYLKNLKAVTLRSKLLKRLPLFSDLPLLRYLQIESNLLSELSPANFKGNPSLEKLHIQFSPRLTRLEANLFDDLPKLDLINITYCGINWLHPRAFSRLPKLKELSLIGNKIVDPGMIGRSSRELPQLEILRLDFNYIGTLDEATFVDMPGLKNIYLSNNVIGEIKKGAFHRLPALKTLDLRRNMLRRVQRQSFLQPISLEELILRENDISDIIQLRYILQDLPTLIYLDVSHNKLDAIPFGSLMGHSTLEQLNLGYNKLQLIDKEAFIALPALRELTLTNNSVTQTMRVPFWNLPALKGLDISSNYLQRLEHGFLNNVGALRRVNMRKNHLTFIDPEAFLATPLLEHINISSNSLKTLHPATLRHLTQLYELDVSRNNLKVLVAGLPRNIEHLHLRQNDITKISAAHLQLPSLRLLDLSENRIQSIDEGQLRSLGHLKKLYLRSNFLRNLAEGSLDGLVQLEILDLSDNRISEINPLSLKSLVELKHLNIANNQLNLLGPTMLSNAKNLRKVNSSRNQLGEILPKTFDDNINIEDIDLSSNLLVQFPQTLYGLEKLRRLDLSQNRLKNVNSTILSSLNNLKEIKLSKNFIQILEENTFHRLKHLKTIFLDENDIMLVESSFIKLLPALKLLKLDKNKLEELPSRSFNTLLSLQNLELQRNNIRHIDQQAFHLVPQILTLNLSHNEFFKIEDTGLQGLRSLELLDLSFNKITKISPKLNNLEWLVELRMKNNLICEVEEGIFGNMPRLRVLDLRNNKLVSFPEVAVERLRENTAELDVKGNPLDCTCDMLWLKSWLRESSQSSPICSDGTFLREMRLSTLDCSSEKRREQSFSGCDTELLNAPNFAHPQLSYTSLKNFSLNGKNSLAPNPQESEYFYDDYIDYPFNSSSVDPSGYLTEKINSDNGTETVMERIPVATKQNGDILTGNTPTLYAATSKKKTKPDIPPKIPGSPSTSGFTFFGIPLPPLGLTNLFGKKDDSGTPPHAERKNAIAILNHQRNDKKQPTPKIGERLQPISTPELLGGFTPILPGSGGFRPIPDPRLQFITPEAVTMIDLQPETVNLETPKIIEDKLEKKKVEEEKKEQTKLHEEKTEYPEFDDPVEASVSKKNYNLELVSNKSSLVISADSTSVINSRNKKSQFVDEDGKVNATRLESLANVQYFNKSEVHYVEEYPLNKSSGIPKNIFPEKSSTNKPIIPTLETTHPPEPTTATTLSQEIDEQEEHTGGILKLVTPRNEIEKEQEILGMETQIKHIEEKILTTTVTPKIGSSKMEENKQTSTGSLLTTLLVPGGQQAFFKPTAKSTITKVASPHGSDSAPLVSSLEVADSGELTARIQRTSIEESIITSTEDAVGNDWYFENYNKKNLEPFIAKIINENCGGVIVGSKMIVGILFVLAMV